ncbi:MAG: hypothetical protein LBE84_01830 [Planctomycetota bacterium]|jgi:hypothetical protein|nr:hypothetical protein [Planctomycetota bacterium]
MKKILSPKLTPLGGISREKIRTYEESGNCKKNGMNENSVLQMAKEQLEIYEVIEDVNTDENAVAPVKLAKNGRAFTPPKMRFRIIPLLFPWLSLSGIFHLHPAPFSLQYLFEKAWREAPCFVLFFLFRANPVVRDNLLQDKR